jgi:hypothetical protein
MMPEGSTDHRVNQMLWLAQVGAALADARGVLEQMFAREGPDPRRDDGQAAILAASKSVERLLERRLRHYERMSTARMLHSGASRGHPGLSADSHPPHLFNERRPPQAKQGSR